MLNNLNHLVTSASIIFLFLLSCEQENTSLELAPLFTDHMVLQQQTQVPIWGKGSSGAKVTVTPGWGNPEEAEVDDLGNWEVMIQTPEYGGPYTVKVSHLSNEILLEDVLLGEVWLASGQSNMEWPLFARINNQEEEIKNANYPQIRMFSVPRNLNGTNISSASWKVTTPENVKQFSAVGYFFAREMIRNLEVPIGILNTSWGGTRVEAWTSIEKLAAMAPSKKEAQEIIDQGGRTAINAKSKTVNTELRVENERYLEAPSFSIPENSAGLKSLVLNDLEYAAPEFDDSSWKSFEGRSSSDQTIAFEDFFKSGTLAENGVVWLRKSFDVSDPTGAYSFNVTGGIDDFDYTYLNGTQIGQGFACCTSRSYSIPEGLLKKEGNVLAIRIIDTGGEGGFKGEAYLEKGNEKQILDQGTWRLKHHAFYLNTSIQLHQLDFESLLKEDQKLKENIKVGKSIDDPNRYSVLFETMVQPVIPYKVKGALWYQGESNVSNHQDYKTLFTGMITDWRSRWGSNFPFYFVQIAPYEYTPEASSQSLREAQRNTLLLEKTGMAITLDIGEEKDIHPANKQDVGLRLARLALHHDYGKKDVVPSGPLYKSQTLHSKYIDLSFDYVGSGLMSKKDLTGFEIAAFGGDFVPAKAIIIGNQIRVSSKKINNPKLVRYGWKNYFEATLFNQEGLPASSFQTP